jgi:transcriptional regulator with XRE-family HTH domain
MANLAKIGYEIRRARSARGLTQAQLAQSSGVSRTTLSQLENGIVQDLGIRKVDAILEHVGLTLLVEAKQGPWRTDYLKVAATTASASFATPLTEMDVLRFLVAGRVPRGKRAHLRTLIEEASKNVIRGLLHQVRDTSNPGRVAANVDRVAKALGVSATRAARWTTID